MKLLYVTINILNISMYLSVVCHAYNGDHSGTCMTPDHRTEIVHHDIGHTHFLTDEFCNISCITISGIFPSHASTAISTILFMPFFLPRSFLMI